MLRRKRVLFIALYGLFLICCGKGLAEEGFISLFNGEDLKGWRAVGTADAFVVKNHSIYTTGASPYHRGYAAISSMRILFSWARSLNSFIGVISPVR